MWLNNGLSSLLKLIHCSNNRRRAFGVSCRSNVKSGFKYPRPTINNIWSLLFTFEYGKLPVSISNITIPKAYTSLWKLYGLSSCILITSGAIHKIEPVGCWDFSDPDHLAFAVASPKSPILTVRSSCKNILLDFRSRWIMFFACRYSMPCAICLWISIRVNRRNLVSTTCKCLYKLLPSHHWVTIANWGLLTQPMNNKMLTWRVFRKTATSFLKAWSWATVGIFTFKVLTATGPCQCALYTVPKDPEPTLLPTKISSAGISQSSILSRAARSGLLSSADLRTRISKHMFYLK